MPSVRHYYRQAVDRLLGGNTATIDSNRSAPPPSPLAPVDLTDPQQVSEVLDLASRVGDVLLGSGTGNTDTKIQIQAIMASYGILNSQVDITLNSITIFAHMGGRTNPVIVFRVVHKLGTDFSKLMELEKLIYKITSGAISLNEAQDTLSDIEASSAPYDSRWALLGWGLFAGSVSITLGGTWIVALIATIVSIVIMMANSWLGTRGLPAFYQNLLGGLFATVPAAITYGYARLFHIYDTDPSLIIASCIVALLAGLTLVQALEDGITGATVTASARFFETILQTGGIIAGIAVGIQLSSALGVTLPPIATSSAPTTTSVFLKFVAGVCATAAFCLASYSQRRSTFVTVMTTVIATGFYYLILLPIGVPTVGAITIAAAMIGFAGGILSRRYRIPPQITNWAGITPLLPGLTLYRGMYAMLNGQFVVGISNLGLALAIACGLASGVVIGEWFARKIRRPSIIRLDHTVELERPHVEQQSEDSPAEESTTENTEEDNPSTEENSLNMMDNWQKQQQNSSTSQWHKDASDTSTAGSHTSTFPAITDELIDDMNNKSSS